MYSRHKISYQNKLFLLIVTFALVLVCCFITFQYRREKTFKAEMLNSQLQIFNMQLLDALAVGASPRDFFKEHSNYLEGLRVTVLDASGNVRFDSGNDNPEAMPNHSGRHEIAHALQNGTGFTIRRLSESTNTAYFYSAMYDGRDTVVRSALPYSLTLSDILSADRHFLWFMLGVTLLLCAIGYLVTRTLGLNMARLRSFSEAIDRGENVIDPPTFPNDELGEISKHLVGLYLRLRQANADIEREHAAALHEQQEKIRIKRQLTNNINHELKTPVSSIKGYLETIIATPDMDETVRNAFITKSYAQTERLQQLISDISTITRLDEASEKIECCDVVLNRIIDEIAAEMPLKSKELQMRIKCNFGHDLHIEGNADMLASIFRNLTDNAVSYSGGRDIFITLLAENDDNYLFSFADNGIGVEEKHLPHLFERFYRVDKGRSRKMGGTGLGLSIVKNAVIFHGGTIEVRNRPEGGLEFLFSLAKKRRKKEQERTLTNT